MDSKRIYSELIEHAKARPLKEGEYYERHHIVPASMGGLDDDENLVDLTAREHYLAHWLLYRIYRNSSMATAWFFMRTHNSGRRYTSHTFEYAKKAHIKHLIGRKLTDEHKAKIAASGIGRKGTERQRKTAIENNKRRVWSEESRAKARAAKLGKKLGGAHGRAKKVINTDTGEVFDCMSHAAESVGARLQALQNSITRGHRCKGYKFEYYT